ncbi:MAG: Ig-like domain-containing protein, partial [Clostridia bacterium]|nr:Ig-like domain-containing protein [Clostridia bacterium]
MRKLLIFLMMALPLIVILIINVTFDAISGVVIIPVDNISIVCADDSVASFYDDENKLTQININDMSKIVRLAPYIYPESASNKQVYWESENKNVANVDSQGNVAFVGFGTTEIYATSSDGTRKSSCLFVVTDVRVHDINIYTDDAILEIGSTTNVWARVFPSTAENQDYTLISTNPGVVSINSAGIATAVSSGEATIIATASDDSVGYNCSASLTIKVVKSVENVRLSPEEENLTLANLEGNKFLLFAMITPIDATNKNVTYTTSDPLVASASNNGIVTFLKAGEVVITVITEDGNFTDSINLKYTGGYPTSLQLKNSKIETNVLNGPYYEQIEYTFTPENPPLQIVTFSSNNESVATVNSNGLIKVFGGGQAVITVKVQTSDDLYYFSYIEVHSERKIDYITFPSSSITVASTNYQITPICLPLDSTDLTHLTYSIIEGDCASITPSGLVTFSSIGQIVVMLIDESPLQTESVSSFVTIIYTGGYPTDLVLDKEEIELQVDEFNYLTFALNPIEVSIRNYYYNIQSQTPNYGTGDVITLDEETGKITGISGGTAVISVFVKIAEDQWVSKSCAIVVIRNITSVTLNCNEEVYEEKYISGQRIFNFTTSIFPLDTTNPQIEYELSNSDIATLIGNQVIFNEAGSVVLTIYSVQNPNIKSSITLWYTGDCAVNATIEGIPETIINGDSPFTVTLSNVIPANATNKSFRITNQSANNTFSFSYNENKTEATVRILNSGSSVLSFLLSTADCSYEIFSTLNISILQKVDSISFQYPTEIITVTDYNLQCNIFPSNATQNEIVYTIPEEYQNIATINDSVLTFNASTNESESVLIIATLTDIDGTIKTTQMQLTTTFGKISSPEGNILNLTIGNSLEYDYSNELTSSSYLNIIIKTGSSFISYTVSSGILSIDALGIGYSEIEIQLLNKTDNKLISILAQLEITIILKIDNVTMTSNNLDKIGTKFVTAQNDILLDISIFPETASLDDLIINISSSIATFNKNTRILHFNTAGIIELNISSLDGSCSRSFSIQYTNGSAISYAINIETANSIYSGQDYTLNIDSYMPTNANLAITGVNEIISSGSTNGIEINVNNGIFTITFIKSGAIKLNILLSDGSQKILTIDILSSLSEIIFENENVLTALDSITLYPILLPITATDKTLTYFSSDDSIATVNNVGVVTFIKAGEVTITAQSTNNPEIIATCNVRSTKGDVSSFTINYTNLTLSVGETRNLIVNSYLPINASNLNFTYEIISSIANDGSTDSIIEINGTRISCLKGGTAIIKVYITTQDDEIIFNVCNITVIKDLTNLSISFDRTLDYYQNYLITSINELNIIVNFTPADATITSQSIIVDDNDIAKIEDGKLIFLTEGIVRVTANYNQKTTTITVRYTRSAVSFELDSPSSYTINGVRNVNIRTGNSYEVKVKNVIPSDLSEINVTLTLYLNSPNYNNDLVCSTNNNIFIYGQNGGSAIFQITVNGLTLTEKLKVNVERMATSIVTVPTIITPNSIYPLAAYVLPYDTTDKTLTYRVISPSTGVSVNSYGVVSFERELTAVIEIKNPASGITQTVTISYEMGAKQITFENSINYVFIGNTLKLITRITPYDLQNEEIEWSVSDSNLSTISPTGVLTPKKVEGEVIVTARL